VVGLYPAASRRRDKEEEKETHIMVYGGRMCRRREYAFIGTRRVRGVVPLKRCTFRSLKAGLINLFFVWPMVGTCNTLVFCFRFLFLFPETAYSSASTEARKYKRVVNSFVFMLASLNLL